MRTISLLLISIVFSNNLEVELIEIESYDISNISNPYYFYYHHGKIYINDFGSDYPIKLIDSSGIAYKELTNKGQGPGEFAATPYFSSVYDNKYIFITDSGQRMVHLFDIMSDQFKKSLIFPDGLMPMYFYLSKNNILWGIPFIGDHLIVGYELLPNITLNDKIIKVGGYDNTSYFKNLKYNPLLKQGSFCGDKDGNIYYSFKFSSRIVGFNKEGEIIFNTTKPTNIDIPYYPGENGRYSAPSWKDHPIINIGLHCDENNIYSLFSGAGKSENYNNDDGFEGKIINVYNIERNQYLGFIKLPYPVRDFFIAKNVIILLSVNPDISLKSYRFKKSWSN